MASRYADNDREVFSDLGFSESGGLQPDSNQESYYLPDGSGLVYGKPLDADVKAVHGLTEEEEVFSESGDGDEKKTCISRVAAPFYKIVPYGGLASNCISFAANNLGGGIIAMPNSVRTSGVGMAIIYLLILNTLAIYAFRIFGIAIEKTKSRTFEETGTVLFGRGWGYFVGFIVALSCLGASIGFISAIGTLLKPIVLNAATSPHYLKTDNGIRLLTVIIWACAIVPIVLPKRINSIRYVSMGAFLMVVYFIICIVVHSCTNGLTKGIRGNMTFFTTGNQAIYGLSIFVFAYLCMGVTYSIYYEMKPKPSLGQLNRSVTITMTVCTVLYLMCGLFGYFDFGDDTKTSILLNFDPVHQPYMMVAYLGMLLKLVVSSAVNMIPLRNFIYHIIQWELDTVPYWKHCLVVFATTSIILIAGLFIPSVTVAFGLVGSICGGFIGFIFPALFWMYCGDWSLKTVGWFHYIMCHIMLFVGVIAVVFGTIATIYDSFIDV
ncbi:Transmembrane amino acid transporter protein, putative [Angomonas deanei]|uniref:Transmembrane amino acid transporter protein, putative n=1 Tax=Angomonas deanei TaxID=59799 RepID=A0A7G2CKJ9_9TRYP|nr:Transmembrane amino acid transporter protein, putative [Angomonas deanei]